MSNSWDNWGSPRNVNLSFNKLVHQICHRRYVIPQNSFFWPEQDFLCYYRITDKSGFFLLLWNMFIFRTVIQLVNYPLEKLRLDQSNVRFILFTHIIIIKQNYTILFLSSHFTLFHYPFLLFFLSLKAV